MLGGDISEPKIKCRPIRSQGYNTNYKGNAGYLVHSSCTMIEASKRKAKESIFMLSKLI